MGTEAAVAVVAVDEEVVAERVLPLRLTSQRRMLPLRVSRLPA
ncbi:hypothetical protein CfE428DRAFT_6285 [Chthoniobacter flavus Ellin428]|uniref:Uncharacterized protein n=1 Tax=Chthoniobacter flavus Ellin428 TaxID=497964 RepID=B4DBJ4_9BACT|nr:hypothetical protein CfE428DRAFT_6285 [Chthoniobacter flavus Ellin428]TCO87182.1 hypothetical protein EV701_12319 [Chthoniobacter flavus]